MDLPDGALVEVAGRVRGRLLPIDVAAAAALVDEVAGPDMWVSRRGQQAWDTGPLRAVVLGVAELWERHGAWLGSVDVNPLIVTAAGPVAVDALVIGDMSVKGTAR